MHPTLQKVDSANVRLRRSRRYACPRSYADITHKRIMGSLGAGSPERGYGCRRIWHVPRANADKCRAGKWRPQVGAWKKRSLTGRRRAPGAPPPQQDDPGRCEAQLDPRGALPAFVPAGVVADFGVEPDTGTLRLEHPLVGRVVLRVVQRRSRRAAIDGVARAERLHRRRARPEGAGDPLVAAVLLNSTADVVYELPERDPLIYSHAPHRPLFLAKDCLAKDWQAARCRPSSGAVCGSPKVGALCTVCRSTLRVIEPGSSSAMASTGTRWCFLAKPINSPIAISTN